MVTSLQPKATATADDHPAHDADHTERRPRQNLPLAVPNPAARPQPSSRRPSPSIYRDSVACPSSRPIHCSIRVAPTRAYSHDSRGCCPSPNNTVASSSEQQGSLHYPFPFGYPYGPATGKNISPATAASGVTLPGGQSGDTDSSATGPTLKGHRQMQQRAGPAHTTQPQGQRTPRGMESSQGQRTPRGMESSEGAADTPGASDKTAREDKPKRVRTGCLTCRTRHLKCDEGKPVCQNCTKSNRKCITGVRLNFIDITVKRPPVMAHRPPDYHTAFVDDSRDIASEYVGGLARYRHLETATSPQENRQLFLDMPPPANVSHQGRFPIQGMVPAPLYPEHHQSHSHSHSHSHSRSDSTFTAGSSSYRAEQDAPPDNAPRKYLNTDDQVLYMQVFVEEVALWMDSMDPLKHFSRRIPFDALNKPILLDAAIACGARHFELVNRSTRPTETLAQKYYERASKMLYVGVQDPNRDTVLLATAAVILNVYETMGVTAMERMNHIAGARALVKECQWNARSTGIGAACFWLNVGMEVLSCLHFNWQVAWHPDKWGVDMDFSHDPGREESWTQRMLYILAKVTIFRATIPNDLEQLQAPNRCNEWSQLKALADSWNASIPINMQPLGYLHPGQSKKKSGSTFPEVWVIKRTANVARLFYHTAMCVLAQTNPLQNPSDPEMQGLLRTHPRMICGIIEHCSDRGIASVALRSLAIAGECLNVRREQEEVLQMITTIQKETGWRVAFIQDELKQKWGWSDQHVRDPIVAQMQHENAAYHAQNIQPMVHQSTLPPTPLTPARPPQKIINPMMASADFNMPQHPYQSYYVPPNPMQYTQNPLDQLAHHASGYY